MCTIKKNLKLFNNKIGVNHEKIIFHFRHDT